MANKKKSDEKVFFKIVNGICHYIMNVEFFLDKFVFSSASALLLADIKYKNFQITKKKFEKQIFANF